MAVYKPFYVRCQSCHERFLPNKSPRMGVALVMTGEVRACPKCKLSFVEIEVPIRPLVLKTIVAMGGVKQYAELEKQYGVRIRLFQSAHVVYALGFTTARH